MRKICVISSCSSFLIVVEMRKYLIGGFHYLDSTEKIEHMVKEMHQDKKRPAKLQDASTSTENITGGFNFLLLL